jgi:hypothetical protein
MVGALPQIQFLAISLSIFLRLELRRDGTPPKAAYFFGLFGQNPE